MEATINKPALIINQVNELLSSPDLKLRVKATILLDLHQVYTSIDATDRGIECWNNLSSMHSMNLSRELNESITELWNAYEGDKPSEGSFASQQISAIKTLLATPNISETNIQTGLKSIEQVVQKRFMPFGKGPVWGELVQTWEGIDREYAFKLCAKLSSTKRAQALRRMNQHKSFCKADWKLLISLYSVQEITEIVKKILEDKNPILDIPKELVSPVFKWIRVPLWPSTNTRILDLIVKFVGQIATEERLPDVFTALKETINVFATSDEMGKNFPGIFASINQMIALGISCGAVSLSNAESLVEKLPWYIIDFARACYRAQLATEETAGQFFDDLQKIQCGTEAQAWFLVTLVRRGMGQIAYTLARNSAHTNQYLPRVHRAWLCNDAPSAAAIIPPTELQNDVVAMLLQRAAGTERVAYLRQITEGGQKLLPGALWIKEKPKEEKKGFLGLGSTPYVEPADEYTSRNPLYSSYRKDTGYNEWFAEMNRIAGYGEYGHNIIDKVLLETFVLWAEDKPEEVYAQCNQMWDAIKPEEEILRTDYLRNAIFNRCTTVFAAVPEILVGSFLQWLRATLVDRSIQWGDGKRNYTLHLPESSLAAMCVQGALAVDDISPERRDQLLETSVTMYPADPETTELVAQLYNRGKALLDLNVPWKLKNNDEESWQVGIVKYALDSINQAVIRNPSSISLA